MELLLLGSLARLGAFSSRRPSRAAGLLLLAAMSSSYELLAGWRSAACMAVAWPLVGKAWVRLLLPRITGLGCKLKPKGCRMGVTAACAAAAAPCGRRTSSPVVTQSRRTPERHETIKHDKGPGK